MGVLKMPYKDINKKREYDKLRKRRVRQAMTSMGTTEPFRPDKSGPEILQANIPPITWFKPFSKDKQVKGK